MIKLIWVVFVGLAIAVVAGTVALVGAVVWVWEVLQRRYSAL